MEAKRRELEKKEKDAARKKEAEEKKEKKKSHTEATRVVAKTSPLVASLKSVTTDELVALLPPASLKSAKKAEKELAVYEAEAKEVLSGVRGKVNFAMEKLDERCSVAKKEHALLEQLLSTLRKHNA